MLWLMLWLFIYKRICVVKFYNIFCNKVYKFFVLGVVNFLVLIIFGIFGYDVIFDVGVINDVFVELIFIL